MYQGHMDKITGGQALIDDGLTGGGSSSVTTSFMPPRKKLRYPLAHWEIILNFAETWRKKKRYHPINGG